MTFEYTENGIKAGGTEYPLSAIHRYKIWNLDNGKVQLALHFPDNTYEMIDVEAGFAFTDMEGSPIEPEHYIITWIEHMDKPECTVKVDGKYMRATFEMQKPKKRRFPRYLNPVEDSDEETVSDSDTEG